MSLASLARAAYERAPTEVRASILFTATDGSETTGKCVGVPASGSPVDGFKAQQMIRDKARRLSVLPDGLAFAPQAGMVATFGGIKYGVLAVSPLPPHAQTVATTILYRVTIQR